LSVIAGFIIELILRIMTDPFLIYVLCFNIIAFVLEFTIHKLLYLVYFPNY